MQAGAVVARLQSAVAGPAVPRLRDQGTSDRVVVQARGDPFADTTDDDQWVWVSSERAGSGPLGATIAHGYLALLLVPPIVYPLSSLVRGA